MLRTMSWVYRYFITTKHFLNQHNFTSFSPSIVCKVISPPLLDRRKSELSWNVSNSVKVTWNNLNSNPRPMTLKSVSFELNFLDWTKVLNRRFFRRRYADGQQAHEKTLSIANHQVNVSQNHKYHLTSVKVVIISKPCWWGCGEERILVHTDGGRKENICAFGWCESELV